MELSESEPKKKYLMNDHILTVLLCAISIPLSMSMWIMNLVYSKLLKDSGGLDGKYNLYNIYNIANWVFYSSTIIFFLYLTEPVVISPARWMASCFIPLAMAVYGYKKKSVNLSGAIFGFIVGLVLTLSNFCFLSALFTFFMTSSKATKLGSHIKKKIEEEFKEGKILTHLNSQKLLSLL